jgi:pimeloyl-ACP methyl ester carboxylesterase
MPNDPETVRFLVGPIELVGTRVGPHDAPLTLLLHGGGQTRHSWGRALAALAAAGQAAIALDLRGHGDSSHNGDSYEFDAFVGDVIGVIEQLDVGPVALVGASLGGLVSLLIAGERAPELCRALVLVDVAPRIEQAGSQRVRQFMLAQEDGFASLEEAAEAVAAYSPTRRRPTNLDGLRKNLRRRPDGRWTWHWDRRLLAGPRALDFDELRFEAAAAAVTVPTLLVRGVLSDVLSERGMRDFQKLVHHAEVANVEAAGHMVAGDDNQRFTASVSDFLARQSPAGTPPR